MKNYFNVFKTWFYESNHHKHCLVGWLIVGLVFGISLIIGNSPVSSLVMASLTVFMCMCAVEYKDKAKGGIFDWQDILAGCLSLIPMWIVVLLLICL